MDQSVPPPPECPDVPAPLPPPPPPLPDAKRAPLVGECPMAKRRRMNEFFEDDDDSDDGAVEANGNGEGDDESAADRLDRPVTENLRQFQVLDEVQGDNSDEEDAGGEADSQRGAEDGDEYEHSSDEGSEDMNVDDLDSLLEENLPEGMKSSGPKGKAYEERFKEVLEEKGRNHFEVLPEGWVQATHVSGMPLFLFGRCISGIKRAN
uniref:(northern house mosquito) hypothetical protein n=1 Tax=Culex pipiens TaxID=7175 RepID=A0A8D8PL00_CULPI